VVTVVMCPGQGAQKVGMGKDLAERFPAARDTFAAIDEALGTALSRLMWEGPDDELTLTHNAQPAILAHSVAVFALVRDRLGSPGAAAGHSLGEYSAHVAAGTLSDVDAARLVRRRCTDGSGPALAVGIDDRSTQDRHDLEGNSAGKMTRSIRRFRLHALYCV